ncbi:hypothetical protein EVAR_62834_1 [Eumeta japonica]|uniref:Uncharacterized protein n=1 Tax=Eumeta variegata TaxID=151549 RepID=A0A4C1ZC94_EUMVA|nr:hypothetical protein EVAR_62834_1 [Eumeta japonica]
MYEISTMNNQGRDLDQNRIARSGWRLESETSRVLKNTTFRLQLRLRAHKIHSYILYNNRWRCVPYALDYGPALFLRYTLNLEKSAALTELAKIENKSDTIEVTIHGGPMNVEQKRFPSGSDIGGTAPAGGTTGDLLREVGRQGLEQSRPRTRNALCIVESPAQTPYEGLCLTALRAK